MSPSQIYKIRRTSQLTPFVFPGGFYSEIHLSLLTGGHPLPLSESSLSANLSLQPLIRESRAGRILDAVK